METLRALYYPYSACLNSDALKRLVLLFDEVWVSDPLDAAARNEFFIRDRLQWHEDAYIQLQLVRELPAGYDMLVSSGVIRNVRPGPIVTEHDQLLSASLRHADSDQRLSAFSVLSSAWYQLEAGGWELAADSASRDSNDFRHGRVALHQLLNGGFSQGAHAFVSCGPDDLR